MMVNKIKMKLIPQKILGKRVCLWVKIENVGLSFRTHNLKYNQKLEKGKIEV
jgi:hypothetical protein